MCEENKETSELSSSFKGLLVDLVGPSAKQLGLILEDQLVSFRADNLNRLAEKWTKKKIYSDAVINLLPFGDVLRILKEVQDEENDDIQELWAGLIEYNCSNKGSKLSRANVTILRSIGEIEANILQFLWIFWSENDEKAASDFYSKKFGDYSDVEKAWALQHLISLQCIYPNIYERKKGPVTISFKREIDIIKEIDKINERIKKISGFFDMSVLHGLGDYEEMPERSYILTRLGQNLMNECNNKKVQYAFGYSVIDVSNYTNVMPKRKKGDHHE